MKSFAVVLILLISAGLFVLMPDSYAGAPRGPPAEIILDKQYYSPGDEVNLEIRFIDEWGSYVELSVIEGMNTGNRIFSETKEISDFSTPMRFSFLLPDDSEFYRHLVVATIVGEGNYDNMTTDYIPSIILYTKEGADNASLSNFFIEFGNVRGQVVPGQSIPIKFEIIDGTGNQIPNMFAHVGICDDSFEEPPGWVAVLPGHRYGIKNSESYSGCVFLQRNIIPVSNGEFDFRIEIPNDSPQGKFKLNIWSGHSYPYDVKLEKSLDVEISGNPIHPDEPAIVMTVGKEVDFAEISEYLIDNKFLTYGQKINFYSYQMAEPGGDIRGNPENIPERYKDDCCIGILQAIPDVNVQITIIGPGKNIVFDEQTNGGSDGNFEYVTFDLTEDLVPGVYEIYYNITKDGNYVQHRGGNNPDIFYLVKYDKFTVDVEEDSFDVYFQGIDVTATDMSFDPDSKSLVFDLVKTDGLFYGSYFSPGHLSGPGISCPLIIIEQPLLHGYFTTTLNDKEIGSCNSVPGKSDLVVGPIVESGELKIVGTYVIPEFGVITIMILLASMMSIVLVSKLQRPSMDKA